MDEEREDGEEEEEEPVYQVAKHIPSLLTQLDAKTDLVLMRDIDSTMQATAAYRQTQLETAQDSVRELTRKAASLRQTTQPYFNIN